MVMDMRDDFRGQLAMSQSIGSSLGSSLGIAFAGYKKRKTQQGIVSIMADPNTNAEDKELAMMKLPFWAQTEAGKEFKVEQERKRVSQERIDYQLQLKSQLHKLNQDLQAQTYAEQGFSKEETDLANRRKAGIAPPTATDPQKQYRDQLKFWTTERDKAAGDYYGLGIEGVSNDPIDPIMFKKANDQIARILAGQQGGGQPIPEQDGGQAAPTAAPAAGNAPATPAAPEPPQEQMPQMNKGQIYNKLNEFMDIRKDYKENQDDFDRLLEAVESGQLTMDEAVELIRQSRNE